MKLFVMVEVSVLISEILQNVECELIEEELII